jgi:hypothetical protein
MKIWTSYQNKGGITMNFDIVQVISQVGFPIAVATYSLVVLNKTVQKNTDVMTRIAAKLNIDTSSLDDKTGN